MSARARCLCGHSAGYHAQRGVTYCRVGGCACCHFESGCPDCGTQATSGVLCSNSFHHTAHEWPCEKAPGGAARCEDANCLGFSVDGAA